MFSILFTSEFHQGKIPDEDVAGTAQGLFGSMGKSMRHLFIMGTILDDITLCCNSIRDQRYNMGKGTSMMIAFIIFVLISSFTMLNMLIGILCEVVCATGEGERNKNSEAHVRDAITDLFHKMDKDNNGEIARDEFLSMKHDKNVMKALKELEVEPKHFEMYADLMFAVDESGNTPTFDFEKTIGMIMRLRPGTKVSALDFASFSMTVKNNGFKLDKYMKTLENMTAMLSQGPPEVQEQPKPEPVKVKSLKHLDKVSQQALLAELQRRIGTISPEAGLEAPSKVAVTPTAELPGFPDLKTS